MRFRAQGYAAAWRGVRDSTRALPRKAIRCGVDQLRWDRGGPRWYSASDIKFLTDKAPRMALAHSEPISTKTLLAARGVCRRRSRKRTKSGTRRFGPARCRVRSSGTGLTSTATWCKPGSSKLTGKKEVGRVSQNSRGSPILGRSYRQGIRLCDRRTLESRIENPP